MHFLVESWRSNEVIKYSGFLSVVPQRQDQSFFFCHLLLLETIKLAPYCTVHIGDEGLMDLKGPDLPLSNLENCTPTSLGPDVMVSRQENALS